MAHFLIGPSPRLDDRIGWIAFGTGTPGTIQAIRTKKYPHRGMSVRIWAARDADHSDNRHVTVQLPSWPTTPPTYGSVVLRGFTDRDAHLAVELGDDPYIPLIGSLPAHPTAQQALEWIHRQRGRLAEGTVVRHRRCRVRQRRRRDRTMASEPVGRPRDGGLRGLPWAPRPRHRNQRVDGADHVRLDHPRPAPGRAVHLPSMAQEPRNPTRVAAR